MLEAEIVPYNCIVCSGLLRWFSGDENAYTRCLGNPKAVMCCIVQLLHGDKLLLADQRLPQWIYLLDIYLCIPLEFQLPLTCDFV